MKTLTIILGLCVSAFAADVPYYTRTTSKTQDVGAINQNFRDIVDTKDLLSAGDVPSEYQQCIFSPMFCVNQNDNKIYFQAPLKISGTGNQICFPDGTCQATAGVSASTIAVNSAQFSGDGSIATPLTLKSSSVTLQGNSFNTASTLLKLDSAGKVPIANMPSDPYGGTYVYKAGDTMTGNLTVGASVQANIFQGQLIGQASSVANGGVDFSTITAALSLKLSSTETVPSDKIDLSTVTTQLENRLLSPATFYIVKNTDYLVSPATFTYGDAVRNSTQVFTGGNTFQSTLNAPAYISYSPYSVTNVLNYPSSNSIYIQQGSVINNVTNMYANDGAYATQSDAGTNLGDAIAGAVDLKGFGFSIPSNAIITGISAKVKRYSSYSGTYDVTVKLLKNGSISGVNKYNADEWQTSPTEILYGGYGDLWGNTLTPLDVNASNFGIRYNWLFSNTGHNTTVYVDYVSITVYYVIPNWVTGYEATDNNKYKIVYSSSISGTPYAIITTDGKVGISTTSPTDVMSVSGNINITGDYLKNGVIFGGSSGSGDNLGSHIATQTIVAPYGISASTFVASGSSVTVSSMSLLCLNGGCYDALPVAQADSQYFLTNTASDVNGYDLFVPTVPIGVPASTATVTLTSSEQLVASYITPIGYPGLTYIPEGIWRFRFNASVDNVGSAYYQVSGYAKIYTYLNGVKTFVANSDLSTALTVYPQSTGRTIDSNITQIVMSTGTRLMVDWYAKSIGNGPLYPTLYIYRGNDYFNSVRFPIVTNSGSFVTYRTATQDVDLNGHKLTANGITSSNAIITSSDVVAHAYYGDGSHLLGLSGGGDVFKASTQTFTGSNTFTGSVTVSSLTVVGAFVPFYVIPPTSYVGFSTQTWAVNLSTGIYELDIVGACTQNLEYRFDSVSGTNYYGAGYYVNISGPSSGALSYTSSTQGLLLYADTVKASYHGVIEIGGAGNLTTILSETGYNAYSARHMWNANYNVRGYPKTLSIFTSGNFTGRISMRKVSE